MPGEALTEPQLTAIGNNLLSWGNITGLHDGTVTVPGLTGARAEFVAESVEHVFRALIPGRLGQEFNRPVVAHEAFSSAANVFPFTATGWGTIAPIVF